MRFYVMPKRPLCARLDVTEGSSEDLARGQTGGRGPLLVTRQERCSVSGGR